LTDTVENKTLLQNKTWTWTTIS